VRELGAIRAAPGGARPHPAGRHRLVERGLTLARRRDLQRGAALALLALAVGTLALLVARHWDELRTAPWRLEPGRLLLGLALQAAAVGLDALVWVDICHGLGAGWNPRRDLRVYAYSLLARRLPGAVWHVLGRAAFYSDAGLGRRVGLMGSVIEAGLIVLTGVAIALASFPDLWPLGALAALSLLAVGPPIFRPAMRRLLRGGAEWLPPPGRLYRWILLYTLAWLVGCLGAFLQFDALYPLEPSLFPHFVWAATSSIVASGAVVIVPGGLGVRELGLTALMGEVIPPGVAAALAVAYRVAIATIEVLWSLGVILILRPGRARVD
jgi:uncharacterized membrane protein YbhN (UPF0104 family)